MKRRQQSPVDELHRGAHLHHGAHLPSGQIGEFPREVRTSHRRGCSALMRRMDAAALQKAYVSSGIQCVVLNGSL
ncbi:Hypothetical predicted protein [Scomber scombrus]|uniref:Uncharacterized protein n=1 Tax=Scomber scombrus TaxID=13677 RepID=A0AAV1PN70_SCOSC